MTTSPANSSPAPVPTGFTEATVAVNGVASHYVLGGQYSAGPGMVATVQAIADNVQGGSVPDAGHWLAEENPAYLLGQLLAFLA